MQVIVFSFSKKECEALALQMAPLDLNDEDERKIIDSVFWNAIDCLSDDDRRLPQVRIQRWSSISPSLGLSPKSSTGLSAKSIDAKHQMRLQEGWPRDQDVMPQM
jgi:hypothetical protein